MTHDPLCPWLNGSPLDKCPPCLCDFIAKVRDDEHSHMGIIDLAYEAGVKYAVKAMTDTLNSLTANGQEND